MLTKLSSIEKEGREYLYIVFEPLTDFYISSSKYTLVPPVTVTSIDIKDYNNVTVCPDEHTKVHLSVSIEKHIEMQNDVTFFTDIVKVLN